MKSLKLLIATAAVIVSTITFTSRADGSGHEKALGILAGYDTRNTSGEAGIFFQYRANSWLRIAPDLTYVTRHKGQDALSFNLNAHFPLLHRGGSGRFDVYPLGGICYTSWNYRHKSLPGKLRDADFDDVTERMNKFGVNVGGGFELKATPTLKLRLEGIWTATRHASTADFTVGIGYVF